MHETCYYDEEPHPFEPEPYFDADVCIRCGAEGTGVSTLDGPYCCMKCRKGATCYCGSDTP